MVLRRDGELAGLAPLFIFQNGPSGTRQIAFVGVGISDYLDILVRPGFETEVASAVFFHLWDCREHWHVCDLQELRPDSPLLRTPAPPEWRDEVTEQSVCPFLDLSPGWPKAIPHKLWENYRYRYRRAQKSGRVTFQLAAPENFEESFDERMGRNGPQKFPPAVAALILVGQYPICDAAACSRVSPELMKQRAATKTSPRHSSMTPRRRNALPAVSRNTSARVSAGRAGSRTARRRNIGEAAGKRKITSGRTSRSAISTTDHDEIREWVEAHGGQPATVKRTTRGHQAAGVLRIDFPGFSGEQSLKSVSWDEWFQVFDQRKLAFLYQQKGNSRFNKLVSRKK